MLLGIIWNHDIEENTPDPKVKFGGPRTTDSDPPLCVLPESVQEKTHKVASMDEQILQQRCASLVHLNVNLAFQLLTTEVRNVSFLDAN